MRGFEGSRRETHGREKEVGVRSLEAIAFEKSVAFENIGSLASDDVYEIVNQWLAFLATSFYNTSTVDTVF